MLWTIFFTWQQNSNLDIMWRIPTVAALQRISLSKQPKNLQCTPLYITILQTTVDCSSDVMIVEQSIASLVAGDTFVSVITSHNRAFAASAHGTVPTAWRSNRQTGNISWLYICQSNSRLFVDGWQPCLLFSFSGDNGTSTSLINWRGVVAQW